MTQGFLARIVAGMVAVALVVMIDAQVRTASAQGIIERIFAGQRAGPTPRHEVAFDRSYAPGTIVISFGDRRLYYVSRRGRAISYPIGVPVEEERWTGTLPVSAKRVNPPWTPTPSMRRKNPQLPAHVPGGHPQNPMGVRALYLGNTMYRIHGTDAPWTIGHQVSQGCIRLYNEDIIDLYNRVPVGTRVLATDRRIMGG